MAINESESPPVSFFLLYSRKMDKKRCHPTNIDPPSHFLFTDNEATETRGLSFRGGGAKLLWSSTFPLPSVSRCNVEKLTAGFAAVVGVKGGGEEGKKRRLKSQQ